MKKRLLTLLITGFAILGSAQTEAFTNLKKVLAVNHPEINLENKLIACNVWNMDSEESRELNKSFDKACYTYKNARLKGGVKGFVVLAVNKDNLSSEAVIMFSKDGITQLISVKSEDIEGLDPGISNVVFDSEGKVVYANLDSKNVFSSIHQLITR